MAGRVAIGDAPLDVVRETTAGVLDVARNFRLCLVLIAVEQSEPPVLVIWSVGTLSSGIPPSNPM